MKNHIDITTDYVHRILNGGLGAKPPEKRMTKNVITPPLINGNFRRGEGGYFALEGSIGYSVGMRIVGASTSPHTDEDHSLLRPPSKVEKTVEGGGYKVSSLGVTIWNFHSGVWAASSDHLL